ncbi:MAG TPA: ABC transporter permease [Herpetosiphonaceae bacterium]|nr:ABC transporter permease [Herpetosiphonaceae bacterium]
MLNLWRAEWLKTYRRPANWGILGITVVVLVALYAILTGMALYDGPGSATHAEMIQMLGFPSGMGAAMQVLSGIGSLLSIVFVANIIGSEYTRDTWKMILPRRGNRLAFLSTKLLMGLFCMALLIVTTLVLGQLLAWIGVAILGGSFTGPGTLADQLKAAFSALMDMAFYGVITLVAAVATRSTIGGIVVGFVSTQVLNVASMLSETAAKILPVAHLRNISAHWVFKQPEMDMQLNQMFGGLISPVVSLAVVLGYIAVLAAAGIWMFKSRDMAGQ